MFYQENKEVFHSQITLENGLQQGSQTFFVEIHTVNILGFVDHSVSVTGTQISYCSAKTAMENTSMRIFVFC